MNEENEKISETQVIQKLTDDTEKMPVLKKSNEEVEEEKKGCNALNEVLSFVKELVICVAVVLLVTNFVVKPVQVSGSSMYPTLIDRSLGVSNILGRKLGSIDRFDVVIIYIPEKNEYIVKRVIGLPGETLRYENGRLYINDEYVAEDFLSEPMEEDISEIKLDDDSYYCLGDNRMHSSDSRVYGPFQKEAIKSKGIFIFWPFTEFGLKTW